MIKCYMIFGKSRTDPDFNVLDTVIEKCTCVTGTVEYAGAIHVRGKLVGDLKKVKGDHGNFKTPPFILVITGELMGSGECDFAFIDGVVEGDLVVKNLLKLGEHAVITGNVEYGDMTVERGATIKGTLSRVIPEVQVSNLNLKQLWRDATAEFFRPIIQRPD